MKILLTNNHLANLGGTETWVLTMAQHLSKEHKIGVYTPNKGYVADLLEDFIDDDPKGYDLALVNHNTCIEVARNGAKKTIFTSHGTEPVLEKPRPGCDIYVAVNENVANKYDLHYIIKNPIDTDKFKPLEPIRDTADRILAITSVKVPFRATYPSRDSDNMAELMNQHDLVISMGRGALEAMSCGRNVIVWDNRNYWGERGDGYMDDPTRIKGFVAGEYAKKNINLNEELAKYDKINGQKNREYILEHHEVGKIAERYLRLW